MGQVICHDKGHYNIYSTIADGFHYVHSLTLDQIEFLVKRDYGQKGLDELPARLERAHKTGCSAIGENLKGLLVCNRAGENEKELTYDECIKQFLS